MSLRVSVGPSFTEFWRISVFESLKIVSDIANTAAGKLYLSLKPVPAAFFPLTEILPSSKFHPDDAETTDAPAASRADIIDGRILMLSVECWATLIAYDAHNRELSIGHALFPPMQVLTLH